MTAIDGMHAERTGNELTITHTIDAPRTLVFKVWTDPSHLAKWWGPKGFTNPVCEIDLRPRGAILIHMRGPDGIIYPMSGEYRDIIEPERLVFISSALDKEGNPLFEVLTTVTFVAIGDSTELTMHASVSKLRPEGAPHVAGMEEGWTQSIVRLHEYVTAIERPRRASVDEGNTNTASTDDREIKTTRVFSAKRELVWNVWTESNHIAHWWGPRGFTNTIHKMDVRPNGVWEFIMHGPDGVDYPNKITYLEVKKPERLVYDHGDEGELSYFRVTVTLEDQGGKTNLTMQMLFKTAEQRNQVVEKYGAVEGLKQNMDKLAEYLTKT